MDNKKLGLILVVFSVVLFVLLGIIRVSVYNAYEPQITYYGESCPSDPKICPHSLREKALIPINAGFVIAFGILSLGIYLIFFEKGQKELIKTPREKAVPHGLRLGLHEFGRNERHPLFHK